MKLVPLSVTRSFGRAVLQTKKNSPHIFFAAGIVGVVGSAVLACRATLKLEAHLDEIKEELEDVTLRADTLTYSDRDRTKDLGLVYMKSAGKLGRLYGPSVLLGSVSLAALTGSHIQLHRRNQALTMTVAALTKAYDEYRARVREEVGAERELELHRGIRNEKIEGSKGLAKVVDADCLGPYTMVFDEASRYWENDDETNRFFLECQQRYMNQRLHAYGHVLLNEVFDALGFERTSNGAIVGWIRDGEGFVDFGLFEAFDKNSQYGHNNFWLDFNVDGVVYDKI